MPCCCIIDIERHDNNENTKNSGKRWSDSEMNALKELGTRNTPTRVMGLKLGLSEGSIIVKKAK